MALNHNVGFYGVAELDGTSILATGGSINLNTEPMFSTGVWGAGWYNAANQVAYAFNVVTVTGDVSFELLAGDVLTKIKNFAFVNRAIDAGTLLKVLPNGNGGFGRDDDAHAWCSECSFDASEGSVVTGGFGFASDQTDKFSAEPALTTGGTPDARTGVGTAPTPADGLYPYWGTGLSHIPTGVTAWSASYSSEVNFLTVCDGKVAVPAVPDYIMVGGMDADGSFTVFGLADEVDPTNLQTVKSNVAIVMRSQSGQVNNIQFAYVIYNSGSTSITTGGDYITADIGFTAVGDGLNPPMNLI